MNEFVIEWIQGNQTASVTFPSSSRWASKIRKLAENDTSVIVIEDKNGALFAHIPVEYLLIRKPKKMNLSEEEIQKRRELLARVRK